MGLMHHNGLRVNALAPDDPEVMDIWREAGWASGPHKDTDPDHPAHLGEIPRVLPEPEPEPAAKTEPKKKD
jgi:hypothetical protein